MWQMPNQRLRSMNRKAARSRRPLHIRRTMAQVRVVAKPEATPVVTEARILLNDLTPKDVSLFSPQPLGVGHHISLTLEDPKRVYVRGRIVGCQEFDCSSPIVSEHSYSYRVKVVFVFDTPEDEKTFREFC